MTATTSHLDVANQVAKAIVDNQRGDATIQAIINDLVAKGHNETLSEIAKRLHNSTDDNKERNNYLSKLRVRMARASKLAEFANPVTVVKEVDSEDSYIVDFVQPKAAKLTDFDKELEKLAQKAQDENRMTEFTFAVEALYKALTDGIEPVKPMVEPQPEVKPQPEGCEMFDPTKEEDGFVNFFTGSSDDNNACTVNALAVATKTPFKAIREQMEYLGRKRGKGLTLGQIMAIYPKVANKFGYTIAKEERTRQTLASFKAQHNKGRYVVIIAGHAFPMIDGVTVDHTRWGSRKIVSHYFKLEQSV